MMIVSIQIQYSLLIFDTQLGDPKLLTHNVFSQTRVIMCTR